MRHRRAPVSTAIAPGGAAMAADVAAAEAFRRGLGWHRRRPLGGVGAERRRGRGEEESCVVGGKVGLAEVVGEFVVGRLEVADGLGGHGAIPRANGCCSKSLKSPVWPTVEL